MDWLDSIDMRENGKPRNERGEARTTPWCGEFQTRKGECFAFGCCEARVQRRGSIVVIRAIRPAHLTSTIA